MDHKQFRSLVLSAVLLGGGFALDFAAHAADQAVQPVSEKKDGTLYSVDLAKYAGSAQTRLEKDPETGENILVFDCARRGYCVTERIPKNIVAGKTILIRADMEQKDVTKGKYFWETAKLQSSFQKAGDKHSTMRNITVQPGTSSWRPYGYILDGPADIQNDLELMIGLQNVSGMLKVKNIQIREYVPVASEGLTLSGSTAPRDATTYRSGEEMVFNFSLANRDNLDWKNYLIEIERSGDDGVTDRRTYPAQATVAAKTAIARPGAVRMVARLLTADGIIVKKNGKEITFTMSGIADFDKIQPGVAEPEDFDAFWDKQKALLAEVPLKVLKFEKFKEQNGKIAYDVQVACAGERPVSGYLVMLRNAAPKSLEAKVIFQGYGATGAEAPWGKADEKSLAFQINAHGYPNGLSPAEYKKLGAGKIFDDKSNENPEMAYFKNMILRAVRALEYVQTLPEWNGKDLKVEGGSQGGYQAIIAAGMLPDQVTGCYAFIPWCCDLGGVTVGRLGGWRPNYTPALRYFDPVYHAKRIKHSIGINAGLADYVCPPSGIAALYNNISSAPKRLRFTQGLEHGGRGTDSWFREVRK